MFLFKAAPLPATWGCSAGPRGPAVPYVLPAQGWGGEPDPSHLWDPPACPARSLVSGPGRCQTSRSPKSIVPCLRSRITVSKSPHRHGHPLPSVLRPAGLRSWGSVLARGAFGSEDRNNISWSPGFYRLEAARAAPSSVTFFKASLRGPYRELQVMVAALPAPIYELGVCLLSLLESPPSPGPPACPGSTFFTSECPPSFLIILAEVKPGPALIPSLLCGGRLFRQEWTLAGRLTSPGMVTGTWV